MTREEVYAIVTEVFRDVFDDDELTIHDETTAKDIPEWDSLHHLNLLLEQEERFGIELPVEEIAKVNNVGESIDLIMKKLELVAAG